MTLRERQPMDSTAPVQPAERPARESARTTAVHDTGALIWSFNLRLMRSGAVLLAGFEVIYFIVDIFVSPRPTPPDTLLLHASAVAATTLVALLTMSAWFERNWRPVCFGNLIAIYGLTLALRLSNGDIMPEFLTLMFTLVAAGALLRWSVGWQAGLSAAAMLAAVTPTLIGQSAGPEAIYRWLGVSTAAALGLFILLTRERQRAGMYRWMGRLRAQIAEREAAQRGLQESEQTMRRIFETSLDAIAIQRWPDLSFVSLNEQHTQIFGIAREEALAASPRSLRLWAHPDQFRRYVHEMATHGLVLNMEAEFVVRDGSVRPFLCSSVLIELNHQQCAVSALRDISELKRIERELIAARETALAASEAKSNFLSVMSHEIRTPMNAILGMTELLCETPLDAEQRRYLETMRNNGSSLLNLVDSILDLSKVESGRLILEHTDFDLVELAEDVVETLALRAHEKGLELTLHIPCTFPTALVGDPLRLRQILINLLGNAIKFTDAGEVTLTIEPAGAAPDGELLSTRPFAQDGAPSAVPATFAGRQALRFAVRDTGIGIPEARQQAIFANFIQADSTISRRYGGTGLGLAIAKRLVELMNGTMTVESRLHMGSTFSFSIALDVQPGANAPSSFAADGAHLAGKRALVVDDSAASRAMLSDLLASVGVEVRLAADGAKALDEIARARASGQPYDAVVADNRMPEPGGAAIAQQLAAASQEPREALVLMLPGNDVNSQIAQLRERGLRQGQHLCWLQKPIRRADLWATLAAVWSGAANGRASYNNGAEGPARSASGERTAQRSPSVRINKSLRILLAEDSSDNRLLVEAYLKDTPCRLDLAENGEVAVHKFMTGHYDAILMDIQMPVMDGYEAVAEIRRLELSDHRRPTPIIALTASAHDEAVRRSLKMGCDAHVTKPVNRSTLIEAIRDAVEPTQQRTQSAVPADANRADAAALAPAQPIVVHVDQDLSDLVPGFLERKCEDARAVLAAAEHGDPEAIARLGHKMKGEGGSYGLDAITDLGRDLEQAGKDRDFETARRLGGELINFLERIEIVYRPVED